jgi:type IV pilus assembly protein PilM
MSILSAWLAAPRPTLGLEISSTHVAGVRMAGGEGTAVVSAAAVEPLPPGAVVPALNAPNVADSAALVSALTRVLERVGGRHRRAGLVLPDTVAKVSLLRFEKVPAREQDLLELVRWQVRKSIPFRIEDAQLTFATGAPTAHGREFLVVVARRDIVGEYESACLAAGVHAGIVDLATTNLVNAVFGSGPGISGDWLLVNLAPDYVSVAIVRGSDVVFYRHRGAEDDTTLTDVVHQTAMYYEDRLAGGTFSRVVLAGAARGATGDDGLEAVRRELEGRLGTRVETVANGDTLGVGLPDRATAGPTRLDLVAPAIGVVLRERAGP